MDVFVAKSRAKPLRVALLSDTHGVLDQRIALLVRECEYAVHAGDIGDASVLDALRPRTGRVVAVRGNNDTRITWPAAQRRRLQSLPDAAQLMLPGGALVVVHGDRYGPALRRHARLRALFPDAAAIVYGHSHKLVCDCELWPWVLNPGAAGRARTFGGPSCLLLQIDTAKWRVQVRRYAFAG